MSEPPTMLIREIDDDRTLIDPIRLAEPDPPFEGSGRAPPSPDRVLCPARSVDGTSGSWRTLRTRLQGRVRRVTEAGIGPVVVFAVVLAVVSGLGVLAYQQWRAAAALRDMITEMNARRLPTYPRDGVEATRRASAPSGTRAMLAPSRRDVTLAGREAAERRGANLIASNDFERALTHYQALADRFPNEAVFRDVVLVLEAKLGCTGRAETRSPACR